MKFGIIGFENYKIDCIIGVHENERMQEQSLYLDLKVMQDFALDDTLSSTICYEELGSFCKTLAQTKKYHLLETFAYDLITALTNEYKIKWAHVKIKKPSALVLADCAFVELESEPS